MEGWAGYAESMRDVLLGCARTHGTPQYVLDEDALECRCRRLLAAFRGRSRVFRGFYPYKTNSVPRLLEIVHRQGFGAEASSRLEMELAERVGAKGVIFNGPGKTDDEIGYAVDSGATIIIDGLDEAEKIGRISRSSGKGPRLGVRLCLKAANREWERFGVPPNELPELMGRLGGSGLRLSGVHFHIGTGFRDPSPYVTALATVGGLIGDGIFGKSEISFVDVGGGIGSEGARHKGFLEYASGYVEKHAGVGLGRPEPGFGGVEPVEAFAEAICGAFEEHVLPRAPDAELWAEPGRYVAAPCVHALAKVIAVKRTGAVLDAGIGLVPNALHEHYPIVNLTRPSGERTAVKLQGPLCMSNDTIAGGVLGENPSVGDVLCILNVGAYNLGLAGQFIKPLAKVVSVSGQRSFVARREEDLAYRLGRDALT
jgi:diaminopimelate decarboxylase